MLIAIKKLKGNTYLKKKIANWFRFIPNFSNYN